MRYLTHHVVYWWGKRSLCKAFDHLTAGNMNKMIILHRVFWNTFPSQQQLYLDSDFTELCFQRPSWKSVRLFQVMAYYWTHRSICLCAQPMRDDVTLKCRLSLVDALTKCSLEQALIKGCQMDCLPCLQWWKAVTVMILQFQMPCYVSLLSNFYALNL